MFIDRVACVRAGVFVRPMGDRHDVDVLEFRAGFAPVAVSQNMVPPDFSARLDFATGRNSPVKQAH